MIKYFFIKGSLTNELKQIKLFDFKALKAFLRKIIQKYSQSVGIYILDMESNLGNFEAIIQRPPLQHTKAQIAFEILSKDNKARFDEYLNLRKEDIGLTSERLENFLEKGCLICLAILDKKIVGCASVDFNDHPLYGFSGDLVLNELSAYNFNTLVLPLMRRKGVAYLLKEKVIQLSLSRGRRYLISAVYDWNNSSIHLCKQCGYEQYGRLEMKERFFIRTYYFEKTNRNIKFGLRLKSHNNMLINL